MALKRLTFYSHFCYGLIICCGSGLQILWPSVCDHPLVLHSVGIPRRGSLLSGSHWYSCRKTINTGWTGYMVGGGCDSSYYRKLKTE